MNKLFWLFVEGTVALMVGLFLLGASIVGALGTLIGCIGLAVLGLAVALFVLYVILLRQTYNFSARKACCIEREHDLALARINADKTVTLAAGGPATGCSGACAG